MHSVNFLKDDFGLYMSHKWCHLALCGPIGAMVLSAPIEFRAEARHDPAITNLLRTLSKAKIN
jgi:hypothetical protein